jgi:hypothetical protein
MRELSGGCSQFFGVAHEPHASPPIRQNALAAQWDIDRALPAQTDRCQRLRAKQATGSYLLGNPEQSLCYPGSTARIGCKSIGADLVGKHLCNRGASY